MKFALLRRPMKKLTAAKKILKRTCQQRIWNSSFQVVVVVVFAGESLLELTSSSRRKKKSDDREEDFVVVASVSGHETACCSKFLSYLARLRGSEITENTVLSWISGF